MSIASQAGVMLYHIGEQTNRYTFGPSGRVGKENLLIIKPKLPSF